MSKPTTLYYVAAAFHTWRHWTGKVQNQTVAQSASMRYLLNYRITKHTWTLLQSQSELFVISWYKDIFNRSFAAIRAPASPKALAHPIKSFECFSCLEKRCLARKCLLLHDLKQNGKNFVYNHPVSIVWNLRINLQTARLDTSRSRFLLPATGHMHPCNKVFVLVQWRTLHHAHPQHLALAFQEVAHLHASKHITTCHYCTHNYRKKQCLSERNFYIVFTTHLHGRPGPKPMSISSGCDSDLENLWCSDSNSQNVFALADRSHSHKPCGLSRSTLTVARPNTFQIPKGPKAWKFWSSEH